MEKREFLKKTLALVGSAALPTTGFAETNPYTFLWLKRGEDSGWLDLATSRGYQAFRYALRDSQTGQMGFPPLMLGYILSWMQTFLRAYSVSTPIQVTSGMRLPGTNNKIDGAYRNSLHLPDKDGVFRAVDFRIPNISGEYTGRLAALAHSGGVGFYGDAGHTHVDVGRVRYWRHLKK